mmetsp:Transcript_15946/g.34663  ORF Transcript_15946/g.34663 Transcript_15946/m.34663 type:complete len:153 (-) Transcript_15946:164-622(-)|eukprot:CAMPEP_0178521812 /NCGR_PEP_ID=MMETSP0696-20121128/28159_1 /TAXON_ID=265572 /ORGANISM="Extubocellulus spinifer, Strain CCMP396" /LENGTH=152 /DNA_ID=CAMNT_0020152805 /DNA_START=354 /DNA_END=812 /DNA_ORIENTATION=-
MTRQVITKKDIEEEKIASATEDTVLVQPRKIAVQKPDGYLDRFLKYIPSEVIVMYITICGALGDKANPVLLWVAYGLCQLGTPLFLWRVGNVTKRKQLFISTLAFYFWAVAYGGPFHTIDGYHQAHNAFLLPLYTFFVPYFDEQDDDADDEE